MTDHLMSFKIRDYKEGDFAGVSEVWNKTGMGGAQRGDNQLTIENTLKADGRLIILENSETGEIIGTSWITNDARRLYLHHFGIKPDYQGKGFSGLLLEESLKFACKLGLQIKLEVHRTNEIAINLYKKYGFSYLGDYNVFIIRDVEALVTFNK